LEGNVDLPKPWFLKPQVWIYNPSQLFIFVGCRADLEEKPKEVEASKNRTRKKLGQGGDIQNSCKVPFP
jgi:hypothetical protein